MSDLKEALRAGDVVNLEKLAIPFWKKPFKRIITGIGMQFIKATQKKVFCQKLTPGEVKWRDNHTMMYFKDRRIFSLHPPKATYLNLREFEEGDKRIVTVYRMNPDYFKVLNDDDIQIMRKAADEIIETNKSYDEGQLLDILVNTIAGYPWKHKTKWFDEGNKNLVCSVAVASIIASWRHEVQKRGLDMPQPWTHLSEVGFTGKYRKKFEKEGHWDIGTTFPANFATTDTHFKHEFIRVGVFVGGKRVA